MGIKIFWGIVLLAACVGGYFWVQHRLQENQMADGAVTCTGCMTPEEKARFDKEDSGEGADGQSERKIKTARQENTAINPQGTVAAVPVAPAPPAVPPAPVAEAKTVTPPVAPAPKSAPSASFFSPASGAVPTTDSQSANAPNGMRYAGSGAYQWYRQGNLTWRVNTATGGSCIAFATMDEWRKPIVYSHGCGRGA
jgi:hypothetical protein